MIIPGSLMRGLLLFLVACRGCEPNLPSSHHNNKQDTSKHDDDSPITDSLLDDSGDSAETGTEPAMFCKVEEVEPNDPVDFAAVLPMEKIGRAHV